MQAHEREREGWSGVQPSPNSEPEHPALAAILDVAMASLRPIRRDLIARAHGQVLEVGVGTGMNFPFYGAGTRVVGVEPDPHMLRRARHKARRVDAAVELVKASGEALPFEDESFDCAVLTWVLCTIPDPQAALSEIYRVLRPGGQVLFAEHLHSAHPLPAKLQTWMDPLWQRLAGGCHLTRNGVQLIEEAGFRLTEVAPRGPQRLTLLPNTMGQGVRP